jgi:uncharacterized protein YbjT (DUF2867 family)
VVFSRGAYFLSNWDSVLPSARDDGRLPTMLDPDTPIPMVAPADLGTLAAGLLTAATPETGIRHVEGPEPYSPRDVAAAFTGALGRPVEVAVVPRSECESTFRGFGFSEAAAQSYAGMTAAASEAHTDDVDDVVRGQTTMREYIEALVRRP